MSARIFILTLVTGSLAMPCGIGNGQSNNNGNGIGNQVQACSAEHHSVCCDKRDGDNGGERTLGLELLKGNCLLSILSDECSQNVYCCEKDGRGNLINLSTCGPLIG